MHAPYGLELIESCRNCHLRTQRSFCTVSPSMLQAFEAIRMTAAYPKGSVLYVEGQEARGVFVLCRGRVKLSCSSRGGRTLILELAEPGEVLGLSAVISGRPHELSAETTETCQLSFVRREDFLRLLRADTEMCFRAAENLSNEYHAACKEVRSLGLSRTAAEKFAGLLLDWNGKTEGSAVRVPFTHEEIAEMIGTSRETVSRLFASFRRRQILQTQGTVLQIRNEPMLRKLAHG
jgi:CRP/FNR family transcriptional regulator